ncbi:MAG: hypothetical protein K2Y25_14830 [Pseudomonadaceae bacterium]|nr:hypothetical protein [Pseudomonadaceae bacterium]
MQPQINDDDLQALTRLHSEYLADAEAMTTSAMQLQDDAYALGYKRAELNLTDARALLTKIMQAHVSALPKATRAEIEALIA